MLFVPDCPVGGAAGFFQYEMLCPLFRQGRLQTGSNFAYDVLCLPDVCMAGGNPRAAYSFSCPALLRCLIIKNLFNNPDSGCLFQPLSDTFQMIKPNLIPKLGSSALIAFLSCILRWY